MNNIHININSDYENLFVAKDLITFVRKILDQLKIRSKEVSISLIDSQGIRDLNGQYRGMDTETDVLSFECNDVNPETGLQMLGDILICVPVAQKQAKRMHHSLKDEINLLMVHGILHLIGYDHEKKEDKAKMFSLQNRLTQMVE